VRPIPVARTAMQAADSLPPVPAVIAIVTIPSPRLAPGWYITHRMRATIPQYAAAPGLRWKAYTQASGPRTFGGVYEWASRAAADRWLDAAWRERVRTSYRPGGRVRLFEVGAGVEAASLPTTPQPSFSGMAILQPVPQPWATAAGRGALDVLKTATGLLFGRLLRGETGEMAILSVWTSKAQAEAGLARANLPAMDPTTKAESFRVPVFLPPAAVGRSPTP